MTKKRVILASCSPEKVITFFPENGLSEVEFIVRKDLQALLDSLQKEACSLVLLGAFKNGFPKRGDVEKLLLHAPRTPFVLVMPDGTKASEEDYGTLPVSEIINETDLEGTIPSLIEKYVHSGFGTLRDWTLDELFDYCFPVITTMDYDPLSQTVLELLKELLMADSGIMMSAQEGRGTGFKLLHASGFHDMVSVSEFLMAFGKRVVECSGSEPDMLTNREFFGRDDPPDFLREIKSIFTVTFDMEGSTPLFCAMFLKSLPHPEVLEGDLFRFFIRQARFALFNAEKGIKVQSLIYIDDLTKLYNARYLKVVLDRELKRSDRYGVPVSVLFLDIDYFKRVNDSYGHLVGSRVLCEFGDILRTCVRETDTVVRYGGDEFVVILVETSPEQALLAAERMRKAVEVDHFMRDEGLDLRLTVSIGIATYPVHAKDREHLLQMADKAMYRGKDTTRNVVYIAES